MTNRTSRDRGLIINEHLEEYGGTAVVKTEHVRRDEASTYAGKPTAG